MDFIIVEYYTYIHTYIQKFILARWPQQLRADFHEGREFRKNILHRQTKKKELLYR